MTVQIFRLISSITSDAGLKCHSNICYGIFLIHDCSAVLSSETLSSIIRSTLAGQHTLRKMISILARASLIIFFWAFTTSASAISLGWVGISNIIGQEGKEYMSWFYVCEYEPWV